LIILKNNSEKKSIWLYRRELFFGGLSINLSKFQHNYLSTSDATTNGTAAAVVGLGKSMNGISQSFQDLTSGVQYQPNSILVTNLYRELNTVY
jgi:hypothetical protein